MDSDRGKIPSLREAIVLVLLALPLLVTASTIEDANWVKGLPSLKALVLVSLVVWAFMARSRVPWWVAHPAAILGGLLVSFVLGALTISGNRGVEVLANHLGTWFGAIGSRDGNQGTALVGVGLIAVTLWMGHVSVWLAYRRPLALLAALPGLGVLLVVLTFLPSDYYWYFFIYLLAAAPGIAYRHSGRWQMRGKRVPLIGTLLAGLALMAITLVPVWRTPSPEGTIFPLASKFERPWYSFRAAWTNLFYGVPNRQQWPFFSPPEDLPYRGPAALGDDTLFLVESQDPHRWRMRVYETYVSSGQSRGWVGAEYPVEKFSTEAELLEYTGNLKAREKVEIGVRMYSRGHTLMSVGEPLAADMSTKVELSPRPSFRLYLAGPQFSYLPPEVMEYRDDLVPPLISDKEGVSTTGEEKPRFGTKDGVTALAPSVKLDSLGFSVFRRIDSSTDGSEQQIQQPDERYLEVERKGATHGPPLALASRRTLVPPMEYETLGSISTATPAMLKEAGQDYPHWVVDRYLQLPNDFPESVRKMARDLTRDEGNPYDMAEAIRLHLNSLPYTLDVTLPPPGQDWVEFFLLVQRRGYCQNYASAMITMLRSLGIPARLVVGFAPGIWDQGRGAWEVQSKHYHAWPEVYFPAYGWVEFEPTPADVQSSLEELGFRPLGGLARAPLDDGECDPDIDDDCELPEGPDSDFEFDLDELLEEDDAPVSEDGSAGGKLGFLSSAWTFLGLGLALALVVPAGTVSYIRWTIPRLGYATVTYGAMCFLGRLAGVGLRPHETPWEYCDRLSHRVPNHKGAIAGVTRGFVTARYGPSKGLAPEDVEEVRASWPKVRGALLGRILLRLLPRRR